MKSPEDAGIREGYVERVDALEAFDTCAAASTEQVCGVYYCGSGGIGKTSLLDAIGARYEGDTRYRVLPLVDFAATEVQSIRGLQMALRDMFGAAPVFDEYDAAVSALREAENQQRDASIIAGLDARAERRFLAALRLAAAARPLILRFDTFERVQEQDVGWWVLQVLLPALAHTRVLLAGRPEPTAAEVPPPIRLYELGGFSEAQTCRFLEDYVGELLEPDMVHRIHILTDGHPLLLNLVLDVLVESGRRTALLASLDGISESPVGAERDRAIEILTMLFADPGDPLNWLIWAMAALHRRFDLGMLRYLIEHGVVFAKEDVYYEALFNRLRYSVYVKPNPEQQSHLLHDEIQRLVASYILPRMGPAGANSIVGSLYTVIIDSYYPSAIAAAADANPNLARQLRAEHLGYTLERAAIPSEVDAAIGRYRELVGRAAADHDYALEELIWREMRTYLTAADRVVDQKQALYGERGRLLQRHRLFRKMELHYKDMAAQYPEGDPHVEALLYLSLAQLRLGKLKEARASIERCDTLVPATDRRTRADLEITWGQIERAAGQWHAALGHYEAGADHAREAFDMELLASAYLNRSYVWALQGRYKAARDDCDDALAMLKGLRGPSVNQRRIFALMNKGSAYRDAGLYDRAKEAYRESLALAQADNNQEAIGELMQHLGTNTYLMGRTLRREVVEFNDACTVTDGTVPPECRAAVERAAECQRQAWGYLIEAFEMAWRTDWRGALGSTLHRLAKVYREVGMMHLLLGQFELGEKPLALVELEAEAQGYPMPLELQYEGGLVDNRPWERLDWLGRALRLFDLSALLADEVDDLHLALEALVELARAAAGVGDSVLLDMARDRVLMLHGHDYQRELFEAMNDISQADLSFVTGDPEAALGAYKSAYVRAVQAASGAESAVVDRLRDLRWRLEVLVPCEALRWLRELRDAWEPQLNADDIWPEIMRVLDDLRNRSAYRQLREV